MSVFPAHHPCFNPEVRHSFGRIHLPVAPKCNIQCNFCSRKYDCVNESRPGVTSAVLLPEQAIAYLEEVLRENPRITVAGIAGPGDPFANPKETMRTVRLIRERFSSLLVCLATNGLNLLPYIKELAELRVSHVTVTINAIAPEVGAKIYAWARSGKMIYRGQAAAEILIDRQFEAVEALKRHGLTVKVNSILIPGVNDGEIERVAERVAKLGVDFFNCIPVVPTEGTPLAGIPAPDPAGVIKLREKLTKYLPQMAHCNRCRADAVGLLGEANSSRDSDRLQRFSTWFPAAADRPYVAVASREGLLVNLHLGEAELLHIFNRTSRGFELIGVREAPEPGGGPERWASLAEILKDCQALLVSQAGNSPREALGERGIRVIEAEGLIDQALEAVYSGRAVPAPRKCGGGCGCKGGSVGCG